MRDITGHDQIRLLHEAKYLLNFPHTSQPCPEQALCPGEALPTPTPTRQKVTRADPGHGSSASPLSLHHIWLHPLSGNKFNRQIDRQTKISLSPNNTSPDSHNFPPTKVRNCIHPTVLHLFLPNVSAPGGGVFKANSLLVFDQLFISLFAILWLNLF